MKTSFFAIFLILFLFACSPDDYEKGFHSWCITQTKENGSGYGQIGVNCENAVEIDELQELGINVDIPFPNPCNNSFTIAVRTEEEDSVEIKLYDRPNRVVLDHQRKYHLWKGESGFQFEVDSLKGLLGRLDSVVQIEFTCHREDRKYKTRRFLVINRKYD